MKTITFGLIVPTLGLAATSAWGQIYVANYGSGTIGEYTLSGQTINASFITGVGGPTGMAESGGYLYVVESGGSVAKYTTSGTLVNATLIGEVRLHGRFRDKTVFRLKEFVSFSLNRRLK
jgi:DNA-binding beta-propeller fold protein YncE